ncbi:Lysozyme-3 [Trichostrongylus colubriformis]|uniref:Lysozyme-3 n=1 Tax=Trichostrongylus colubriformis TaxID=6319 RepID=A0AAN8IUN1_TRICO
MTPQPTSKSKTGAKQFDEMYEKLQNANIDLRTLWVQVTSPRDWSSSSGTNVEFLNSIFGRALEHGLTIGIYTNEEEWNEITDSATTKNVKLWYWSARGCGAVNESPPNFDDFQPFASWTSPSVKQFAKFENICGVMVNRNIYSTSLAAAIATASEEKCEPIIVGGVGLGGAVIVGKPEIIP